MRGTRWALVVSLGVLGCAAAPPPPPPPCEVCPPPGLDEPTLKELLAQHDRAEALAKVANPDWAAFVDAYYAPDALVMPEQGQAITGREAIIAYFASFPPASVWETETVSVQGSGDHATLHTRYHLVMNPPDAPAFEDRGKALVVKRRGEDGRWLTTFDMFSSDGPTASEPSEPPSEAPTEPAAP